MSAFKAKMYQIQFWLGSLQRSPDPLAGLRGPTSKGRGEDGIMGRRRGREVEGEGEGGDGKGRGGEGTRPHPSRPPPIHISVYATGHVREFC